MLAARRRCASSKFLADAASLIEATVDDAQQAPLRQWSGWSGEGFNACC